MKILNINAVLDPVTGGGTAERTVQITRSLIAAGFDSSIMTTDLGFSDGKLAGLEDVEVFSYHCLVKRFYIPLVRYSNIKNTVDDFDVVHLMGHWTVLNVLVYLAVRALGKPYIVCPAGALPIFGRSKFLKKLYNFFIGNNIIKNANAWVAITPDEKSQFIPYGVNPDKITIIPNGINPKDFTSDIGINEFRKKHDIGNNNFMLFLGRINIIKGPDILLDAFIKGCQNWKDWHLVYAGPDGGLLDSLKKTVHENNLSERVHFIGYVGGDEKSAAYHAANLLVIPSRQEAMSIVVLEAGISETPVILTDQCGFDEIGKIGGGKVSTASVDGIYSSLLEVLKDPSDLDKMGKKLKEFVNKNYTWSVVIVKYIELYKNLINLR